MNKNFRLLSLVFVLVLLLTACGGGQEAEEPATSEDPVETTEGISGSGSAVEMGFNGEIEVTATLEDGKLVHIQTGHEETDNLGGHAIELLTQEALDKQTVALDSISGATYSSEAFLTALGAAIEDAGADLADFSAAVEDKVEKTNEEMDADVVVVGAGGAGFAAAISAKEAGAENVILIEKMPSVGGNTLISGGEYAAPGNTIQSEEGIEDSPELFAEDVEKAGGDPELIKVLSEKALSNAEWMRDEIGIEWLDSLMFFGGHSVKRSLIPVGHSGVELINKYHAKAEDLGIPVLTEHDAKELIAEDGKIVGIKVETPTSHLTIHADAVILTTGGFGANKDMLYEYDQEVDEYVLSTNSPGSMGDGITMGEAVGADTVGMDQIQLYPVCDIETGKLLYVGDTRLVGGALLVNKEGERFVEELDTRRAISLAIKDQTDHVGYLVWDEKSSEETGTIYSHAGEATNLFDRGMLYKADSLEELAEFFGVDSEKLIETVANFNANSVNNEDPEFNLRMLGWTIEEAPFYMLKTGPAVHHTMGGLKINPEAQVINTDGEAIEGLYAAGEVTGGIHGSNRLGSAAMTDISVYGKIAGENAASFIQGK